MPRAKKNPVTEMPVIESQPVNNEPGLFDETQQTRNNVVPISTSSQPVESNGRDWSDIDSVLSDVVNFI